MRGTSQAGLRHFVRYGPLTLGNRISARQYEQYLRGRIHRDEAALIQLDFAAVGMQFEYSERGERHVYEIERSWQLEHTYRRKPGVEVDVVVIESSTVVRTAK